MKEMTDEIAFAIWRRFFDQLRFDCLACHARGLFHRPPAPPASAGSPSSSAGPRSSALGPRSSSAPFQVSGFNLHPSASDLPDDMTPDEFRELLAFVHSPTFEFLCRTLLRREGAYIRRLLQLPPQSPSLSSDALISRSHFTCGNRRKMGNLKL